MSTTERKPILKKKPTGKFKRQPFQQEDIPLLAQLNASANWSEMGAMKTTTAEWLWEQKTMHIPNPRVLVITTKSGKGTYYESLAEVLPEWDVYAVSPQRTNLVIGSKPIPVDVRLPNPLYMRPVVAIAHYHCFTDRACIPKQVLGENKLPILNDNGTFEMTEPKCLNLLRSHWDMIVCDEAHRLKNPDAQWTRNIKKLKSQFKHLMTGTGFVNNPAEVWSLLNWLYPETYTSYWRFREHYCEEDDYSGYRKIVGIKPKVEEEFRDLVRRVGVRRTMLECFPDIKEPIETVIPVELNATQRKMYNDIKTDLLAMDQAGTPLHSPNVLSMLNRLRQITVATPEVTGERYDPVAERTILDVRLIEPSSKLDATMELIEGLEWDKERKDQVVVFSNFRDPLALLKKRLDVQYDKNGRLIRAAIPYLHLHAGMNDRDRYTMWHDEWPKKEHQVFLCTLAVGSESINLTSANRAVFLDQSWSPAMNKQAIGRVYRPGQTQVAQLIYIRADDTVDFRVLDAIEEKHSWFTQIFGVKETGDEDDNQG